MIRAVCVGDQEGTPFLRHCNGISALFLFYHTPINELAILPLRQSFQTFTALRLTVSLSGVGGTSSRVYFGTVLTLYVQVSVFFSWEGNATRNGSVV